MIVLWCCRGKHQGVETEWHFAQIASSYNVYMDADATGPENMANAALYTHFPLADHCKYTRNAAVYIDHPRLSDPF